LGINSRDLFALLLDADERSVLIPAQIWTPWFSVLGAKSGFDSVEECYGDLAALIPAVETGLSSNPPMNWALSSLDRYGIISNSDAHSPDKLGREATVFNMELSYPGLREALSSRELAPGIAETIEFFPQEGKYHYNGHRSCGVVLPPSEAASGEGLCPVCGKPLTQGVLSRTLELADRSVDEAAPCTGSLPGSNRRPYRSLIPLKELLGELLEIGTSSKRVEAAYHRLIETGGSEYTLLKELPLGDLEKLPVPGSSGELLAAALGRMRAGEVSMEPGYDGKYGVIRVFSPEHPVPESSRQAGMELFSFPASEVPKAPKGLSLEPLSPHQTDSPTEGAAGPPAPKAPKGLSLEPLPSHQTDSPTEGASSPPAPKGLSLGPLPFHQTDSPTEGASGPPGPGGLKRPLVMSEEQEGVIASRGHYALIIAGPGTGKTATLAARIGRLIREGEEPASILALSFTVKAAGELRERIGRFAPPGAGEAVTTATFHSLCAGILREEVDYADIPENFKILPEGDRELILRKLVGTEAAGNRRVRWISRYIERKKQFVLLPKDRRPPFGGSTAALALLAEELGLPSLDGRGEWLYKQYQEALRAQEALDFDDLVSLAVRLLAQDRDILARRRSRFRFILVDEYQDINFAQYALIRLLAGLGGPGQGPLHLNSAAGEGSAALIKAPRGPGQGPLHLDSAAGEGSAALIKAPPGPGQGPLHLDSAAGEGSAALIKAPPGPRGPSLWVIGDPNQAIYGFRGADPQFIGRFAQDYPGAERFFLSRSFRCAAPVTGAAGRLVGTNLTGNGGPVNLFRTGHPTDKAEGEGIARWISALVGGSSFFAIDSGAALSKTVSQNCAPADCAILLRTTALAPPLIKALEDHGIPWELTPDEPWWEQEPLPAVLEALGKAPLPGQPPVEAVQAAWETTLNQSGQALPPVEPGPVIRLKSLAAFFKETTELLDTLAVSDPGGIPEIRGEGVKIMSIHASKGLEYDHVFAAALEEGLVPFTLYDQDASPEDIAARREEERRLLYVAMTRARKGLYLSWAQSRNFRGRILKNGPSSFIQEIETLIPFFKDRPPPNAESQLRLF
jgi:superfamily I DNA/RNA helicase/PHP family Zn ribbon phosphoesterase